MENNGKFIPKHTQIAALLRYFMTFGGKIFSDFFFATKRVRFGGEKRDGVVFLPPSHVYKPSKKCRDWFLLHFGRF